MLIKGKPSVARNVRRRAGGGGSISKWNKFDATRGKSPLIAPKWRELDATRGISPLVVSKQKELDAMRGISPLAASKWKELDARRGDHQEFLDLLWSTTKHFIVL